MFLTAYETFSNFVEALRGVWETVIGWDWTTISTQVKNWLVGGGGVAIVIIATRYGIPFLKGKLTNKKFGEVLLELAITKSQITAMDLQSKTVKEGVIALTKYAEAAAEINLTSKLLSQEQKANFQVVLDKLHAADSVLAEVVAIEIEKIVEDGEITQEEIIELAEKAPIVKEILGTNINDIVARN